MVVLFNTSSKKLLWIKIEQICDIPEDIYLYIKKKKKLW